MLATTCKLQELHKIAAVRVGLCTHCRWCSLVCWSSHSFSSSCAHTAASRLAVHRGEDRSSCS